MAKKVKKKQKTGKKVKGSKKKVVCECCGRGPSGKSKESKIMKLIKPAKLKFKSK